MKKSFVFTMDDDIRFLQELTKSDMQSKKKEEYYGCFMDNAQKRYGFCSARNTGIFISKNERIDASAIGRFVKAVDVRGDAVFDFDECNQQYYL
jgi:hypothetical protein